MNILKLFDTKTILVLVLSLIIVAIYFSKNSEIEDLKDKNTQIYEKLTKSDSDFRNCSDKLITQNKQIEDLQVKVTYTQPKSVEKIKNVYIKDKTCQAELKAYKELFND